MAKALEDGRRIAHGGEVINYGFRKANRRSQGLSPAATAAKNKAKGIALSKRRAKKKAAKKQRRRR